MKSTHDNGNAIRRNVSPAKKQAKLKTNGKTHLHVLDTNVLMHDPQSLFRFEEHDVYIPPDVLEELDNNKKGNDEKNLNARITSRKLDEIFFDETASMSKGVSLIKASGGIASGKLFIQMKSVEEDFSHTEQPGKADNRILSFVKALKKNNPGRKVILVSNDINMRLKARALGLVAQQYLSDKVIQDSDLLHTGLLELPQDFWDKHSKDLKSGTKDGQTFYGIQGPLCSSMHVNQLVYYENDDNTTFNAVVTSQDGNSAMLRTLTDYTSSKNEVWGIHARNREQSFVLNLLMNPDIHFVTLLGQAGTGKTLLALAAGLSQTIASKLYKEIIMTRVTVSMGEDIGFLPGTEEEKMRPWMGALDDNLDVLIGQHRGITKEDGIHHAFESKPDWPNEATRDLMGQYIKIKSLNFMRGRTFLNKYLIIDEAQNLTPKQMKALITRAGPGTKVVCMGNLAQIDTNYLTEGSSGLTYVVDRFKGWQHGGHCILQRGERSLLADYANEVL